MKNLQPTSHYPLSALPLRILNYQALHGLFLPFSQGIRGRLDYGRLVSVLATAGVFLAPNGVFAQITWNGAGANSNWSTGANWSGGISPASGNSLAFGGTTRLSNTNDTVADTAYSGITFNSGAGAFTLTGNRITLGGNVTNSSASIQSLGFGMILTGTSTFSGTASIHLDGAISGSGGITYNDGSSGSALFLSGSNSYTGNTTLTSGVLILDNSNALGSSSVTQTSPTALTTKFQLRNNITVANSVTIGGGGFSSNGSLENLSGDNTLSNFTFASSAGSRVALTGGSLTISNNITDLSSSAQAHRFLGSGTLILTGNNSGAFKTGASTFFGLSGAGGATLAVGNNLALGVAPVVLDASTTVRSADTNARTLANTWTINSTAPTVTFGSVGTGDLTLSGTVSLGGSTQVVVNNTQTTLSNAISQTVTAGVIKSGSGVLQLSGTNTYTGATTVNAGVLQVDGSLASGSAVGVGGSSASGTPILSGAGTVSGAVTLSTAGGGAAGTVNPGTVGGVGTLTVASMAFQNGSTFAVDLTGSVSDKLTITGAATFAGTNNISFTGATGATVTTGPGNYVLATIGSGTNLTTGAFTGTAPTYYRVLGTGTQLNLTHQATIGTVTTTPLATDIITGGSTTFGVTVANTAPTNSSSLSAGATAGANTTGSITAGTITAAAGATSSSAAGLAFNGTTVGAGQTGSFSVTDPNADNTPVTGNVTVNVHDHASGSLSGSTLNVGNVHLGYTSPVTSSNSVTASNASGYRVDLKGSASPSGGVSVTSVSGIAAGGTSGAITATLATGQGVGAINTPFTYTFADNSALSGASNNIGTTSVTVSGEVYSGLGTWTTHGSGTWGTLASNFGSNWGSNQGSPGLDAGFTSTDTATFGNAVTGGAIATVSLGGASPSLKAVTFDNTAGSYIIDNASGGGTLKLNNGGSTATITDTNGSHTISAPVELDGNGSLSVANSGDTLTISGVVSEAGGARSLTTGGGGVTHLSSLTGNSYTGGTTINAGTLRISNPSGSATGSGGVNLNAATLEGTGSVAGTVTTAGPGSVITVATTGTIGNLSLGGIAGTGLTLNLAIDGAGATNSSLSLGSGGFAGSGLTLNLYDFGSNTLSPGTIYTLATGTGGTWIDPIDINAILFDSVYTLDTTYGVNGILFDVTNKTLSFELAAVPEPGTWAMMLGGMGCLLVWQRRKKS